MLHDSRLIGLLGLGVNEIHHQILELFSAVNVCVIVSARYLIHLKVNICDSCLHDFLFPTSRLAILKIVRNALYKLSKENSYNHLFLLVTFHTLLRLESSVNHCLIID